MNRNVLLGVGLVALIIVLVVIFMPGADEPAGDVTAPTTPPATNDTTAPAAPAPSN